MVVAAALFPVVVVVAGEMGVNAGVFEDFLSHRFYRPPIPLGVSHQPGIDKENLSYGLQQAKGGRHYCSCHR